MSAGGRLLRFKLGKSQADIDRVLRFLIPYAYRAIPVYRALAERHRVDPHTVQSAEDLNSLPIVSKQDLLAGFPKGVVREGIDPLQLQKRFTSGSTGVPFVALYSSSDRWFRRAGLLRAISRCTHLHWPLRIAELGIGAQQVAQLQGRSKHSHALDTLRPFVVHHIPRAATVTEQVRMLRATRADVVTGHPSLLQLAAEELVRSGLDWRQPRIVLSRGEVLSPRVRELLGQAFSCPVVDFYNCEEIGNIAWQCPLDVNRMHVNQDLCQLEIIDEDGAAAPDGKVGRVVVTSLYNTAMPFIRYLLDDRAAIVDRGRCACGYKGTTISLVQGRSQDLIVLPNGKLVSPRVVDSLIAQAILSGSAQANRLENFQLITYQIIQETEQEFTIRMAGPGSRRPELPQALRAALQDVHPDIHCSFRLEDELPLEPSGKRRAIISRVMANRDELS
jgi:phenylacetate-CoA ligase